jgi:hypothetical protein
MILIVVRLTLMQKAVTGGGEISMIRIALAITALTAFAAPSNAYDRSREGTPAEQRACARDLSRFCGPLMDQGDNVRTACLQQNRQKLTAACRAVLASRGQ